MTNTHIRGRNRAIVAALRRANGHRQPMINKMENGKPCADITQHLKAAKKAVTGARRALIVNHKTYCLDAESSLAYVEGLQAIAFFEAAYAGNPL